ncbi:MAG TPA: PH domain-containing protein, partial [Nitrososphaeraceae archaeon]|nr:PH domain-containing protein [Nitrososphaeraceae archaeon]
PNIIYATDRRIIVRDPYMLGIKENVVDIPYDIITSVKLEKGLLSSTIRFKAPGLMSSTRLGMIDSIVDGEDDQGGIIEAIPKDKAEDLLEIIRSGMQDDSRSAPSKKQKPSFELLESKEYTVPFNQSISIADELRKLAKLKEEGILTEEEFKQMKQELIRKNR